MCTYLDYVSFEIIPKYQWKSYSTSGLYQGKIVSNSRMLWEKEQDQASLPCTLFLVVYHPPLHPSLSMNGETHSSPHYIWSGSKFLSLIEFSGFRSDSQGGKLMPNIHHNFEVCCLRFMHFGLLFRSHLNKHIWFILTGGGREASKCRTQGNRVFSWSAQ